MIKYTSQNQIKLELFEHPFERALDKSNRWVKLSELIPWDNLAALYSKKLQSDSGRESVDIRTVLAALIIKHKLRLSDRGTIEMIQENVYLQYFCGLDGFTTKAVFDPSLFVDIRKRMGNDEFAKFNEYIIEVSEGLKPHQARIKQNSRKSKNEENNGDSQPPATTDEAKADTSEAPGDLPKNKGSLKVDATVADQEIRYPNDVALLNDCRLNLERMIKRLYSPSIDGKRPRLYQRKAHKAYLSFAKKRRKTKKEIRRAMKAQLQYVRRDLKVINKMLLADNRVVKLDEQDENMLANIQLIYEQQKWMYDNKTHSVANRIVSLFQPQVRPIVRGKDKNKVEFGAKINVSLVDGFVRIDQLSWDAFNEGTYLIEQVENYRSIYGCYPAEVLADAIYMNTKNRKYLKERNIKTLTKPLGRPPKKQKETAQQKYRKKKKAAKRNQVEGKFGQGKRGYGLNNIKARLPETSESWINAIMFVMNLTTLLQMAEKYGKFFIHFFIHSFFQIQTQIFYNKLRFELR